MDCVNFWHDLALFKNKNTLEFKLNRKLSKMELFLVLVL